MWRKPSALATCSILEPGSVMAMKWLPALSAPTVCLVRSKKYCLKMLGSSVEPDLLETIKIVFAGLICESKDLTWAGSVESRTCNFGYPLPDPYVFSRTSGQRLDPPMPSKRTSVNPACLISSARRWKLPTLAICCAVISSQPSHDASSVLVQSEASFCQSR